MFIKLNDTKLINLKWVLTFQLAGEDKSIIACTYKNSEIISVKYDSKDDAESALNDIKNDDLINKNGIVFNKTLVKNVSIDTLDATKVLLELYKGAPVKIKCDTEELAIKLLEAIEEELIKTAPPTPVEPEISGVSISVEKGLTDSVEIGTKVASISVSGGTEPFTYTVGGGENDSKFNIESKDITAKEKLTEGNYKVKAKVSDKNKKTKTSEETIITVAKKPDPKITNVTIDFPKGLKVGDPQTKAKAKIADINVEGGTPPYLPLMTGGDSDAITVASTELFVGAADLTAKTYQVKIKVCDSKQKDYDYTGEFTVSPADE